MAKLVTIKYVVGVLKNKGYIKPWLNGVWRLMDRKSNPLCKVTPYMVNELYKKQLVRLNDMNVYVYQKKNQRSKMDPKTFDVTYDNWVTTYRITGVHTQGQAKYKLRKQLMEIDLDIPYTMLKAKENDCTEEGTA